MLSSYKSSRSLSHLLMSSCTTIGLHYNLYTHVCIMIVQQSKPNMLSWAVETMDLITVTSVMMCAETQIMSREGFTAVNSLVPASRCARLSWAAWTVMACLHEAIVAAIGRATDRRDDRVSVYTVRSPRRSPRVNTVLVVAWPNSITLSWSQTGPRLGAHLQRAGIWPII